MCDDLCGCKAIFLIVCRHDKFQTSGYKYSTKNDQPLQASSKLVKIRESEQPHFDDSQDHTPLGAMVETWNEHDFEHHTQNQQTNEKSYSQKKNKFINQSREGHVEQDDDINDIDLSRNDSDDEEKRKSPTPEQAFDNEKKFNQHKELLEAKNMLAQAMKDAQFLIKQENDIDDLATNTHKQDQLDKVGDINREMDEIEKMITNQDESNAKRQPMENSMSSIKSSKKHSVVESSRDPFDKLEDIGKNVTPEEVQMMEKTARTMKDAKRRPWADKGNKKAVNRTDYNKDVEDLEDDQDQEDQKTEHQSYKNDIMDTNNEIKASGRYDYNFNDTHDKKIFATPDTKGNTRGMKIEEDFNIAAASENDPEEIFKKHQKKTAKTQSNFHKDTSNNKRNEDANQSVMSEPNGLNQEIWNQNFEALKSSYLKVMNKNKSKTNGFNNYNFRDSADTFNSAAKPPKQKQPIKLSAPHAMSENEYEKFRQTFKDEEEQNQESISDSDNIDNINVGMTVS